MNDLHIPMTPGVEEEIGQHIHGCDICQEVCPRNHEVLAGPKVKDPFLEAIKGRFDLERLLFLESFEEEYYREIVGPIMYNYIRDPAVFRRNAAVALGNSGNPAHIPALQKAAELYAGTPVGEAARRALQKLTGLGES